MILYQAVMACVLYSLFLSVPPLWSVASYLIPATFHAYNMLFYKLTNLYLVGGHLYLVRAGEAVPTWVQLNRA